jgi:hypothetical protein
MLNDEQKRIANRLRERCEKLLKEAPARVKARQDAEDADAAKSGRQARDITIDPIVEIPYPLLVAILDEIGDAVPEDCAEHVASYRQSCEFFKNTGTTNVLAWQLLKVMGAATGKGAVSA